MLSLEDLLDEYRLARDYTAALVSDLSEAEVHWRPEPKSSAIGWHLGHQGAVNHVMIRNLMSAEASLSAELDRLFDSATPEEERGIPILEPPLSRLWACSIGPAACGCLNVRLCRWRLRIEGRR